MNEQYRRWTQALRVPLGFVLAAAFWLLCRPSPSTILWGGGIALAGVGLRFWAAGHIEKSRVLTTSGPYAFSRNPLYLGSLIIGFGFGVVGGTMTIPVLFAVYFFVIYWPVMKQEEQELRSAFKEDFERYARQVPLLMPRLDRLPRQVAGGATRFELARAIRNREYNAILGYIGMLLMVYVKYRRGW